MTSSPEVSVVLSVYNGQEQLAATLESVLGQADCNFEFIVVDDGSSDGSNDVLDRYARQDPRMRVIHQENAGLTRALIRGCAQARGVFIARQDAGDLSRPGRLMKQVNALRADPNLAFVSCRTVCVGPKGEYLFEWRGNGLADEPIRILDVSAPHGILDGPSHHSSVMFRRSSYLQAGGYREAFYFGQDGDLWYRLAEVGLFRLLPEVLYEARIGIADLSTSNKFLQEEFARLSEAAMRLRARGQSDESILRDAAELRPRSGKGKSQAWRVSRGSYFIGECLRRNGNCRAAREYLWQALRADPTNVKAGLRLLQALGSRQ